MTDRRELVERTARTIADYRDALPTARVFPNVSVAQLREALGGPLPENPTPAADVITQLERAAGPGLVATAGPRYFGFVVGGSTDASLCADLLAVGWDQVAFNPISSPAAAVAEEAAGAWLVELLGLPPSVSVGFVTGGQAANTVGLAAARHHVLAAAGWDVSRDGLSGAPAIRVIASVERHATIDRALRVLGLGTASVEPVASDLNGAIDTAALEAALVRSPDRRTIVCLQAGNVNTGACDDLARGCEVARGHGAWVHVDGAFGLWAAASPTTRHLVAGLDRADSWACDGHKWLNVPYDSGFSFCARPDAHAAAMSFTAEYLVGQERGTVRNPSDFVLESSRRARGFAVWAAIRELGRCGIGDLVERCCQLARRFAEALADIDGVEVVNDVVLNQVLVRCGDDKRTERVLARVQESGVAWMGGTTWRGARLIRISVSSWATTEADVDMTVTAIRDAVLAG